MGPESNLHGSCHVRLRPYRQHWKIPLLILHKTRHAQVRTKQTVSAHREIAQCGSARNKLRTDFLMPIANLNKIPRAEVVRTPGLDALTLPANPTSHQISIICVPIGIPGIRIEYTGTIRVINEIRIAALNPQI